ncbi:hypothetical protein GIB67_033997 [Kingdonia uniflora]|uniref:Transmembrane protein n=1 Tax=Kingdonia uniflora TaxID=39325 RepID=A0A7J7M6A4_9MAGN|nr:hypothetical protein GIB67_033997 [Kingdonia uniflora]
MIVSIAASSMTLSPPPPHLTSTIFSKSKPPIFLHLPNSSLKFTTPHYKNPIFNPHPSSQSPNKNTPIWRISAITTDVLPPDTTIENTQQIVSSDDGAGVFTIISALLFIAFVGLSILTIGVVYIGVTDFLQKRESKKFQEEEAAKKSKKKGKNRVVRSRTGPKGFGQKVVEFEDDDDL